MLHILIIDNIFYTKYLYFCNIYFCVFKLDFFMEQKEPNKIPEIFNCLVQWTKSTKTCCKAGQQVKPPPATPASPMCNILYPGNSASNWAPCLYTQGEEVKDGPTIWFPEPLFSMLPSGERIIGWKILSDASFLFP